MASKTIPQQVLSTQPPAQASYRYYLSDSKDDGPGDHPRCLCAEVEVRANEYITVFLENVERDQNGVVTGRVAVAGLTQAQVNALKSACLPVFTLAATAGGYT